jgi:hypothetical protein
VNGPKTLILDIENSPILADVWGLWKNNVGLDQIRRDWIMLSWAAKWQGDDHVYSDALPHYAKEYNKDPEDDAHILYSLRDFLNEADVVVGHNSTAFDLPKIRARMLTLGMEPFSPVQEFDTLKIAKQQFKFSSNKLAFIAECLGLGQKLDTGGHLLWVGCLRGDKEAWRIMEDYNCQDVVLTEQVYDALSPWSKSHPNIGLYVGDGEPRCTVCGCLDLARDGHAYTSVGKYQRFRCKKCGKYVRGRKNVAERSGLLTNVM